MQPLPLAPARVLAVSAHPDDVEYFAGATVARLARDGAQVTLAVCTDGSLGAPSRSDPAALRAGEQRDAAHALGIAEVAWLGFSDGGLAAQDGLRRRLIELVRRVRPELVLAHDPRTLWTRVGERVQMGHSDHRAAGQAVLDAVYPRALSGNFNPALGAPWCPREIWLFDSADPDHFVETGDAFETKLAALRAHASQEAVAGGLTGAATQLASHWARDGAPAEAFTRLRIW
jgi:LmbE family N-acetylglucosaminyl deacetylase